MQLTPTVRAAGMALGAWLLAAMLFTIPAHADDLADVQALVRQGNLTQATDRLNAFLAKNPKDARGRFMRGLILTEQKRPAEAVKVFVSLTEEFPELPEPYNNLAVLYAAQGQFDRARQMLEMAIRTHPSYATAHENLGDIYAKMASEAYDKALQIDRSNVLVQTKLSLIRELFSSNPKFQRSPLASIDAPRQVAAGAAAATAALPGQASKGAGNAPPPAAGSRPVAARAAEAAPALASVASTVAPTVASTAPPAPAKPAAAAAPTTSAAPKASAAQAVASAAPPAATPAAAPAAAAASATPAPAPAAGTEVILKTIEAWAQAWSDQDVKAYLSFYARDFRVPGGNDRADWEQQRRTRIERPGNIEVRVLAPQVTAVAGDRATVAFRQDYRSDTLKSQAPKTLTLVRVGGRWLIEQEQVGR